MRFASFAEFYRFYLHQHRHPGCRRLHVAGVLGGAALAVIAVLTRRWFLPGLAPVLSQGLSWLGHVRYEKNRPAIPRYPLQGFVGVLVMTWDTVRGRLPPDLLR